MRNSKYLPTNSKIQPPICCIQFQGKIKIYVVVGEMSLSSQHMHEFINENLFMILNLIFVHVVYTN